MKQLILIRHAPTVPRPDQSAHTWTLSDAAAASCAKLAKLIQPQSIGTIVSSEEPKAKQTAAHLGEALQLKPETAPDLHETMRETAPYFDDIEDFQSAIHAAMQQPDLIIFGEEAFGSALIRFEAALTKCATNTEAHTMALVTHGTVMSLYLGHITQSDPFSIWRQLEMPAYARISWPEQKLIELVPRL